MKKIFLYLLLVFLSCKTNIFGQVGINTTTPNNKAVLHVSETNMQGAVQSKGIIIPRLTEIQRDAINPSDSENSLMIFNTDENCYNFWNKEDGEWKSVCGNMGDARFTYNCSDVQVKGDYVKEKELGTNNYIEISNVNITKPGAYTITAVSTPDNGYSYTAQGTFATTGMQTIRLQAQGIPINNQVDTFTITSSGDASSSCQTSVTVKTNIAAYAINCSSVLVNGTYVKGTALTASNTISMIVNVSSVGSYSISTGNVNGISFSASGTFSSTGTQTITLTGSGSPTVNLDFPITITTNTVDGNSTCSTTIPVTLPAMTYALIGNSSTYSWMGNNRSDALTNGSSFGPNGLVKTLGLSKAWDTNSANTAITQITNNPPDVLIYFAYSAPNSSALSLALANYVNKGGVLLFAANSDGAGSSTGEGLVNTQLLLTNIFGATTAGYALWQGNCSGNCPSLPNDDNAYQINNLPGNNIVNGPFGNLSGKYWGEDNSTNGTVVMSQLPPNSIQVCSANNNWGHISVNPDYSSVWYNESKNIFMFGDDVGANNGTSSLTDDGAYPSIFTAAGLPLSKQYGNGDNSGSPFVYNAALELNAFAWALKKAASAGINPH